jgi:FKBP-type peptidyl-prolyl cis-trans isomerase FkpA
MVFKKSVLFVFLVVLVGCEKKHQWDNYTKDSSGFYFKLLGIGDGNESPKGNCVAILDAVIRTTSDSIVWDTKHDAVNGLPIKLYSTTKSGSHKAYYFKMVEGDSVSFLLSPKELFRDYFDTIVPKFFMKDSLLKLDVKLIEFMSVAQFEELKNNASAVNIDEEDDLQELQHIDCYLKQNQIAPKISSHGIYTIQKTTTNDVPVSLGKKVKVAYRGFFLDGKPVDVSEQTIECVYGTPDQFIKGLNIVIGTLKKGETTKIIVPSRLAFGEFGSSNNSIPPYTPLVYNIKIIDIK